MDGKQITTEYILLNEKGEKLVTGVGGAVHDFIEVTSNLSRALSPAGAKAGIVQSIPAGIQPPTIKDFKVINGMAYLFLKNTTSAVSYGVAAGQAPGNLAPVSQQPVSDVSETIIVTPATGAAGFFLRLFKRRFLREIYGL